MVFTRHLRPRNPDGTRAASPRISLHETFRRWSARTSEALGTPAAFVLAAAAIVVWGVTGPLFHFSDTWQLVVNTATNVVTFLMVFLIQATQNRDAKATHLKLGEVLRSLDEARNELIDLENSSDEELALLQEEFRKLRERAHARRISVRWYREDRG